MIRAKIRQFRIDLLVNKSQMFLKTSVLITVEKLNEIIFQLINYMFESDFLNDINSNYKKIIYCINGLFRSFYFK